MTSSNVVELPIKTKKETETMTVSDFAYDLSLLLKQLGEVNEQNKQIFDLMHDQVKNKSTRSESQYLINSPYNSHFLAYDSHLLNINYTSPTPQLAIIKSSQDKTVKLHNLLIVGSIFVGFICLAGLLTWLISDIILVNPFAAILGLIASPFFFVMGKIAKNA